MLDYSKKDLISKWNKSKALVFIAHGWNKKIKLKTVQFTGIKTIQWIRSKGSASLTLDYTCLEGEATFFLVQGKEIYFLFSDSGKKTITIDIPVGWIRFRIAGKQATIRLESSVS